jgi:hypothetical protein
VSFSSIAVSLQPCTCVCLTGLKDANRAGKVLSLGVYEGDFQKRTSGISRWSDDHLG